MNNAVSLITGAAGFIGSHLVHRLVAAGDTVHALVRETTALDRLADLVHPPAGTPRRGKLVVHRLDLADYDAVRACVAQARPTRVFHLAAETRLPAEPTVTGARGATGIYLDPLLNLVEALASLPEPPGVLVRAGTIAEYGRAELPYREHGSTSPVTPYGAGMLHASHVLAMLGPSLPFPAITARLALCYGPGQSSAFLVPQLIEACMAQRPSTVMRPDDRRDLIHIDDVVDALVRIAELAPQGCDVVNICSGAAPDMGSVARRIIALTGCDPALVSLRQSVPGVTCNELRSSPERARLRLGWQSTISLDEGLKRTIAAVRRAQAMAE